MREVRDRDPEMGVTEVDPTARPAEGFSEKKHRRPSPGLPMRHAGRLPVLGEQPGRSDRRRCSRRWNGRDRWRAISARLALPRSRRAPTTRLRFNSRSDRSDPVRRFHRRAALPTRELLSRLRTNSFKKGQQLSGDRTKPPDNCRRQVLPPR